MLKICQERRKEERREGKGGERKGREKDQTANS